MDPYIAGIHCSIPEPVDLPKTSILSIVQLQLHPRNSLEDGTQPANRLWNASLDYVRSIPGYTAFYWATLKDDPETIIILLQWEDPHGWKRLQESIGFGLMLGLLSPNCFNRAAWLAIPSIPEPEHRDLELVSFHFQTDASAERKENLEAEWKELLRSVVGNTDVFVSGGWVERDGPSNPQ